MFLTFISYEIDLLPVEKTRFSQVYVILIEANKLINILLCTQ